jgi:hypothetical protein
VNDVVEISRNVKSDDGVPLAGHSLVRLQSVRATPTGSIPVFLPPCALITGARNLAEVDAAERDHQFIAHLPAQRPRLKIRHLDAPAYSPAATFWNCVAMPHPQVPIAK